MLRALAVLAALLAMQGAGFASEPVCSGSLSGAVKARFRCSVSIAPGGDDAMVFEIRATDRLEGVPGYSPGAFELPAKAAVRTYTLDDLGMGRASVAAEGGTLFTASKTSSQRGEVTIVLKSVTTDPNVKGGYVAHGTYRARLLPVGGGKEGEVVVEVSF